MIFSDLDSTLKCTFKNQNEHSLEEYPRDFMLNEIYDFSLLTEKLRNKKCKRKTSLNDIAFLNGDKMSNKDKDQEENEFNDDNFGNENEIAFFNWTNNLSTKHAKNAFLESNRSDESKNELILGITSNFKQEIFNNDNLELKSNIIVKENDMMKLWDNKLLESSVVLNTADNGSTLMTEWNNFDPKLTFLDIAFVDKIERNDHDKNQIDKFSKNIITDVSSSKDNINNEQFYISHAIANMDEYIEKEIIPKNHTRDQSNTSEKTFTKRYSRPREKLDAETQSIEKPINYQADKSKLRRDCDVNNLDNFPFSNDILMNEKAYVDQNNISLEVNNSSQGIMKNHGYFEKQRKSSNDFNEEIIESMIIPIFTSSKKSPDVQFHSESANNKKIDLTKQSYKSNFKQNFNTKPVNKYKTSSLSQQRNRNNNTKVAINDLNQSYLNSSLRSDNPYYMQSSVSSTQFNSTGTIQSLDTAYPINRRYNNNMGDNEKSSIEEFRFSKCKSSFYLPIQQSIKTFEREGTNSLNRRGRRGSEFHSHIKNDYIHPNLVSNIQQNSNLKKRETFTNINHSSNLFSDENATSTCRSCTSETLSRIRLSNWKKDDLNCKFKKERFSINKCNLNKNIKSKIRQQEFSKPIKFSKLNNAFSSELKTNNLSILDCRVYCRGQLIYDPFMSLIS